MAQRVGSASPDIAALLATAGRLREFHRRLREEGLATTYEAAHARLALESLATAHERLKRLNAGTLQPLADPASQAAADQSYLETAQRLADGLVRVLTAYESATDPRKERVFRCWQPAAAE